MSLKYEPSAEPLNISENLLLLKCSVAEWGMLTWVRVQTAQRELHLPAEGVSVRLLSYHSGPYERVKARFRPEFQGERPRNLLSCPVFARKMFSHVQSTKAAGCISKFTSNGF